MAATDTASNQSPDPNESRHEPEPVVTGTLFMMILLLLVIFGFWVMMYVTLLRR